MGRGKSAVRKIGAPGFGGLGDEPLARSAILSHYAQVASSVRLNVGAMLRRVGIDAMCLINPNLPIPASRAVELIERSAIEAGSQDFGLRLALARGIPDLGPLNRLLREEPDLRSALRSLQRHFHVHSRSIRFTVDETGDIATLSVGFTLSAALPFAAPQSTEMVVCGILQMVRWLIGETWTPVRVCFAHPGPRNRSIHRNSLQSRVQFKEPFDGLALHRADLDRPIKNSSPELRDRAEEYVRSLEEASPADFQQLVAGLISALLPSGRCSATAIARHLGMNRSTLNRRLAHASESYSTLLQATRMSMARRACLSGGSLTEVAQQLGFADPTVFSRWFSRSFGCTATAWRKAQRRT